MSGNKEKGMGLIALLIVSLLIVLMENYINPFLDKKLEEKTHTDR